MKIIQQQHKQIYLNMKVGFSIMKFCKLLSTIQKLSKQILYYQIHFKLICKIIILLSIFYERRILGILFLEIKIEILILN